MSRRMRWRSVIVLGMSWAVTCTRCVGADSAGPTTGAVQGAAAGSTSGVVAYAQLQWNDGVFTLNGQPFTGVAEQRDRQGRLRARYPMVNGRLHGQVEEWYTNGVKSTETMFENNQRHGTNRYWDVQGRLIKIQVWQHDQLITDVSSASSLPAKASP